MIPSFSDCVAGPPGIEPGTLGLKARCFRRHLDSVLTELRALVSPESKLKLRLFGMCRGRPLVEGKEEKAFRQPKPNMSIP